MRSSLILAAATVALLSPASALFPAADALARSEKKMKSVKACSRFGNGCLVAPVRQGRFGLQARLRSGTWIDCRGDCRETIRQDVLDFWETQAERAAGIP